MRKTLLVAVCSLVTLGLFAVAPASAQDGPGGRYVTVTVFHVPNYDRGKVFPWMEEYFLPGMQLNPNVRNFRVMWHNWGSDATEVLLVSEFDDWADIEAECGQPCDDYYDQHEAPEEGEEGWEEWSDAQRTFSKYYSKHRDEIYFAPTGQMVIEGQMQGTVGPDPEDDDE